jgi:hypothetical protein
MGLLLAKRVVGADDRNYAAEGGARARVERSETEATRFRTTGASELQEICRTTAGA